MDVSIIIISFNTKELTLRCLGSVYEKTKDIDYEVIVIDNNSHDGSSESIERDFPKVKIIQNRENIGFGKANNLGTKLASGKYLLLLNSDTVLINNSVKILFDFMEITPKAAVCGGNLYNEKNEPTISYSTYLPGLRLEINNLFYPFFKNLYKKRNWQSNTSNKPIAVGYVSGADMMINSALFRQQNGFDTDFFMYYEEAELTFRLKKAGYSAYNVPEAKIIHLESRSLSDDWKLKADYALASRKLYFLKTGNKATLFACNCIYLITIALACIKYGILRNKKKYESYKYLLNKLL